MFFPNRLSSIRCLKKTDLLSTHLDYDRNKFYIDINTFTPVKNHLLKYSSSFFFVLPPLIIDPFFSLSPNVGNTLFPRLYLVVNPSFFSQGTTLLFPIHILQNHDLLELSHFQLLLKSNAYLLCIYTPKMPQKLSINFCDKLLKDLMAENIDQPKFVPLKNSCCP